jgi:protein ImuA
MKPIRLDLSRLPTAGALARACAADAQPWRPGVTSGEVAHGEIFASGHEATGAALALALALDRLASEAPDPLADAPDERAWLWVQDPESLRRTGRPYRPGLPRRLRHRLVHVAGKSAEDALFALEEGMRCRDLAFVIGEIAGNPKALTFTASRRLSLAAERHSVPLWLVRIDAARELSSARMRWQVCAAPSMPPRWNDQAPGAASWRAELFRARRHPPGEWILRDEDGGLVQSPLPFRGEDTKARRDTRLAAVGEGGAAFGRSQAPLPTLSPAGERTHV